MYNIVYKKIYKKDENQLRELINVVLRDIERPEFFIPFTEIEIANMFDESKTVVYGAYDNEKLIITAHPDNKPSNSVIKNLRAKLVKTTSLEGYLRNIYLLEI